MKTLLKISWRNVWRNKARSLVIIMAIACGLWGGTFATALMTGMIEQKFNSTILNQVSHIQVHHPEFIRENQTEFVVTNPEGLKIKLENSDKVLAWTARTLANGMIANASMTSGVEILGIDPAQENRTTHFQNSLIEGDYFESVSRNPVLIGKKLADKMKISTGNRIVLTLQDIHGDITSASFRVSGIYRTSNTANDERNVYVRQSDLLALLGEDGLINEVAILMHNLDDVPALRDELKAEFPGNEIRTWAEISPDLSFFNQFSGMMMMILLIIILMALAFGLLNTMLMTIFERTRELGVLISVGMSKKRVFLMILLETTFLVITGSLAGSLLGAFTVNSTGRSGVDLTGFGAEAFSDFGFEPVIYPVIDNSYYLYLAVMVLITSFIASVYPAIKALKLNPADAVRRE
jgi:ABC-type lipoprotein release transport system permease subunit